MIPQSAPFRLLAPAKINMFLHITGKRDDGYHLLQSLMIFVDAGDVLEFSPHDSLFVDVDGPFAHELTFAPQDNLVIRAARLLGEEYNVTVRGKIILHKNLPIASGIGGGSSDAATALIGLSRLMGLRDEPGRLQRIASKIGADVSACLVRRPVWVEGIGEKVTPLAEIDGLHLALVNPMRACPTPHVYKQFSGKFSQPLQFTGRRKSAREWIADFKIYRNDLTLAAKAVCPDIPDVLRAIEETPGCHLARLSGSGATCFGLYETREMAQSAVAHISEENPDWWVSAASIMK